MKDAEHGTRNEAETDESLHCEICGADDTATSWTMSDGVLQCNRCHKRRRDLRHHVAPLMRWGTEAAENDKLSVVIDHLERGLETARRHARPAETA